MKEFPRNQFKKRIRLVSIKKYSLYDAFIATQPKNDVPLMQKEHLSVQNQTMH